MPTTPFLFALQEHLPQDAFPWVVAALMHDPLVWSALHGELGLRALETLGSTPTAWHPGALAHLALETAGPETQDDDIPLPPATFTDAARLALALTAFRRDNGQWEGLLTFMEGKPTAWRTPLACALAWADDAPAFLAALASTPEGVSVALDALLSQPLPPEVHAVRMAEFLQHLPITDRLPAAWALLHRRPGLARLVVPRLPAEGLPAPYADWQRAASHAAQGQTAPAHKALAQAWENLRRLSGLLAVHQAQMAEHHDDLPTALTAWEQAAIHLPSHPEVRARHALALYQARHTEEARALLPEKPHHPALQVAAARLLQTSHPETARRHALEALAHLTEIPADLLPHLTETLRALGEPEAAARAALHLAARRPDDLAALDMAADAASQTSMTAEAAEMAFLAYRQHPTSERLRRLASAQENANLLEAALQSRRLLAANPEATPDDHLALARLALRADLLPEARQATETVLAQTPSHPQALTLMGQVLAREGQTETARHYLEEAIAQRPADARPYLALAEIVAEMEGEAAALDVLQTAAHALPDDPEVHYRLGLYLLALNRPGHARAALETAHRLAPQRADIATTLAEAYLALGDHHLARDLLHRHHHSHPTPKTARLLAQAHLAANEPQAAAALLAPLSQQADATPRDLYLYAQALLTARTDPEHAEHALQLALSRLPQNDLPPDEALLRADLLAALAQSHLLQHHPQDALEAYRQAMQALPAGHPRRQTRKPRPRPLRRHRRRQACRSGPRP